MWKALLGFGQLQTKPLYYQFCIVDSWGLRIFQIDPSISILLTIVDKMFKNHALIILKTIFYGKVITCTPSDHFLQVVVNRIRGQFGKFLNLKGKWYKIDKHKESVCNCNWRKPHGRRGLLSFWPWNN